MKFTYNELNKYWGQDPTLDKVISLLGEIEGEDAGGSFYSVDDIGIAVTQNGIDLVDEQDANDHIGLGSVRMFNHTDFLLIRRYLTAYLITNRHVLEPAEISVIDRLIDLF